MVPDLIARPEAHLICCSICRQLTPHPISIEIDFDEHQSLCRMCARALRQSFTPYRATIYAMVFIGECQKGLDVNEVYR